MPTNVAIKSIPLETSFNNSSLQSDWDALGDTVKWCGTQVRKKETFYPTHGTRIEHVEDNVFGAGTVTESIFSPNKDKGWKATYSGGSSWRGNSEFYGDGRWMPASVYNGFGFRSKTDSNGNNALYMNSFSIAFANRTTGDYRIWGENLSHGVLAGSALYGHFMGSDEDKINEIRSWGSDWLFSGLIVNIKTGSGVGSTTSSITVYGMKVFWKYPGASGNKFRAIPNGVRAYGHRNHNLARFTDPYQH